MLVASRVGMIGPPLRLDAGEVLAIPFPVAPENDHAFPGVIARTPKPVVLMTADHFRQSVFRAEKIDRAGLAVTVGEDRRLGALLGRKRVVNLAHFPRHLLPAEFVREMLGQGTVRLVLRFR